jgi:hypothetical protein
MDPSNNKWNLVYDFTPNKDGQLNYKYLEQAQFQLESKQVEGLED